ncbi:glycosyltransferase [Paenalcaligenes niemegkensis]|uniref:glycosyltransferase family 2 protein n=1 Tax=Paenalcaligenes niemegkensis TaxID=2895469 RepID=UPI001EE7A617|nr:glycosyltransferase [Paenalcaligenes niemegkensis]MCQ9617209.1 glycosyltransferase [Paenalcaligenes niemegkensis]
MTNEHSAVSAKITVVVLTHNRCEEVCRTLMHLQALPEDPPIIVVDNGSTDHTAQQIKARFPQATLVQTAQNLGAAGRNLGVKLVKTPYVAFCDDDTWWASGALSTAASLLDTHPDVSVLNARIVVGPRQELDSTCMAMQNSPLESVVGVGPMLIGFMAGANVMRTRAYKEAGGYWKAFFIGGKKHCLLWISSKLEDALPTHQH